MAKASRTNPDNRPGNFFVDTRCIGCHVCERLAPETFTLENDLSYVKHQPDDDALEKRAIIALLSCPVFAIGMKERRERIDAVTKSLPLKLHENVYFCGYNARSSFGASAYFIRRERGNILIDSPRFDRRLLRALEEMGGIRYIYLTHKDDIADYQKFKHHFGADVIYHADDFNYKIQHAEITLRGEEIFVLDEEVTIIPQPGHTRGHTVLLYKAYYLFSGDHLAYDAKSNRLYAFKDFCWYDWLTQLHAMERLLQYDFSYLLPGHGAQFHTDAKTMRKMLKELLMRASAD